MPRLVLTALLFAAACCRADDVTLLQDVQVQTLDPARPRAEAIAWDAAGRVVAVGGRRELQQAYPQAERLGAGGAHVVPGLVDAHGHLLGLGLSLLNADLRGTASRAEVLQRLRAHAAQLPADAWLVGRGWDQNDWPEKAFPNAADLDAAFPERPVYLRRIDGHAAWVNSAALRRATRDLAGDWQPEGGRIERVQGKPSGVLVDAAMGLVEAAVPKPDADLKRRAYTLAFNQAVAAGLTGVHDAGVSRDDLAVLRSLADAGALPLRVYAMADGDQAAFADLCRDGRYAHAGGHLQMRAIKLYIDGALGSRGAALHADYSDDPGNRGLLVTAPEAFREIITRAKGCGVQVAAHAIGDRGNRIVLDAYADVLGTAAQGEHRWRIEHAQVVDVADIPRFARLRVIASMQPTHATSDMSWAPARLGPQRLAGAYAWRRFLDARVALALGSDFPIEQVSPLAGIYAAVTRQDADGQPVRGWLPAQRLKRLEALRGFSAGSAYASFAEADLGAITVGRKADFTLLQQDLLTLPAAEIPRAAIVATIVDGKTVFGALEKCVAGKSSNACR